uniref:Uncharacterized protein n=1 Tax=Anopheles coluzzii TaxID=1518534 RepID=A0A8W7PA69_ANOCL
MQVPLAQRNWAILHLPPPPLLPLPAPFEALPLLLLLLPPFPLPAVAWREARAAAIDADERDAMAVEPVERSRPPGRCPRASVAFEPTGGSWITSVAFRLAGSSPRRFCTIGHSKRHAETLYSSRGKHTRHNKTATAPFCTATGSGVYTGWKQSNWDDLIPFGLNY